MNVMTNCCVTTYISSFCLFFFQLRGNSFICFPLHFYVPNSINCTFDVSLEMYRITYCLFFFMSLEYILSFRSKYGIIGAHTKGKKIKRRKTKKYGWKEDVRHQYHFQGEAK